jgi:hypothetical protein
VWYSRIRNNRDLNQNQNLNCYQCAVRNSYCVTAVGLAAEGRLFQVLEPLDAADAVRAVVAKGL